MGDEGFHDGVHKTAHQSLEELAHCVERDLGAPSWWVCVAKNLDEMREELATEDIAGIIEQVTAETPQAAHHAVRVRRLHAEVAAEAVGLRLLVADRAGIRAAADEVRHELLHLLARVRRLYTLTDALLLDAYALDIGGGD